MFRPPFSHHVGSSMPSLVSSSFSYGGSKLISRKRSTSAVNLSTSLIE